MNLNEYTVKGDPARLLEVWERTVAQLGKEELVLNLVTERADGITILDACPTEADFQSWIHGDAWRHIKAELGGDVEITRLGEVRSAIAQTGVVDVTVPAHA